MGNLLCARFVHPLMVFLPSLVSAYYDLLHMETDIHLPLTDMNDTKDSLEWITMRITMSIP